jgi:L-aminopeptidase/D-esterase-like protein
LLLLISIKFPTATYLFTDVPQIPTVLITNQKLDHISLNQIARQVHSSMARAVAPFHTIYDGDVLYAVTTNEVEHKSLGRLAFGTLAAELAWDAVLSAVNKN